MPSHKPKIDVIIKTGSQTVYSPFFTSSLTHYAPMKVFCEQHSLALVLARHLQYAGPDSCLALEFDDSSRLMRYESGLAASPFARSVTRNTSHLLCPGLGVASGEPVGRDFWLRKSYVTGWLTTDSWATNLQYNTRIASRVFQVTSHNWWEVMVFILFNT